MRRSVNNILLGSLFSIVFVSCGDSEHTESEVLTVLPEIPETSLELNDNHVAFEGGIIELEKQSVDDDTYTLQSITREREDISFRAERVPSALYLANKGLSGKALERALEDLSGEQLFYFEFEEALQQDLLKKYFQSDFDTGVSYLSFDIFRDFLLVNSQGDTLVSDYSLYERNFHVAPYERILVSFSGVDQEEAVALLYNDQLFGKGNFEFRFASTAHLENNIKNPS